jgi:ParB/RepB/Spo0J family partition protein
MTVQYVEFGDAPTARHVVRAVGNGKTKKGSKQGYTACDESFAVDDAIIFAQPSSTLMNRPAAPICKACCGESGHAPMLERGRLAEHAPATNGKASKEIAFAKIRVDQIRRSPLNHRKTFDGLEGLGDDIKVNGLKVPIKVRPVADGATLYELVYGERRWRAAKLTGVEELPSLIQELTDLEVLEEQLVENVSREEVHPLEEADGYKALRKDHGYSVEDIARRIGKSTKYVHDRIKLCELGEDIRELCFAEKINASIALLIARIPVAKLQAQAAKDIVEGVEERKVVDGKWGTVVRPMSFREAHELIQESYMLRLENAPFPVDDAELVKAAGSCTGCLFRTGNQRELFADVKSADVCTNPPCFAKKRDAQFARDAAEFKKTGGEVLTKKETAEAFDPHRAGFDAHLRWGSGYGKADEKAPYEVDKKHRPWPELFGSADKVPVVLAQAPDGTAWKLVDLKAAKKALEKSAVIAPPRKAKSSSSSKSSSSTSKPRGPSEEELIEYRINKKVLLAIGEAAGARVAKGERVVWEWLAKYVVRFANLGEGYRPLKALAGILPNEPGPDSAVEKALVANKKTLQLQQAVVMAAASDYLGMSGVDDKDLAGLCKLLKIDAKKLAAAATEEVKRELATKTTAKPAKTSPKKPAKKGGKS